MTAKRATKTSTSTSTSTPATPAAKPATAPAAVVAPSRLVRALEASIRGETEIPPPPPSPPLVAPPLPEPRPRIVPVLLTPEVRGPASWTAELKTPRGTRVLGARYLPMRSLARGAWALRIAVLVPDPDAPPVSLPLAVVREGDDATAALTLNYISNFEVDGTYFHIFVGRST